MARDLVTKLKHADEDPDQIFSDPELYRVCSDAADKIQGLEEDLNSALNVAYNHGASEWVIANYPDFKPIRSGGVRSDI